MNKNINKNQEARVKSQGGKRQKTEYGIRNTVNSRQQTVERIEIRGKVGRGNGYGRVLGFPTVNLDRRQWVRLKLKPKLGVYAGTAEFKLKTKNYKLKAGIVIGPIDKKGLPKIEAHIINFKGNLYGNYLTIFPAHFLRSFNKYKSEAELKAQIAQDIKNIKKIK
jgi:riboflavin kinase / FMN adenylyltransferase